MKSLLITLCGMAAACPSMCRCTASGRVFCQDKGLTEVPANIPADVKYLYLQDNKILNSPELNTRLARLPRLERLFLYNNLLEHVPAFDSNTLSEMALYGNQIRSVDGLGDLPNLRTLNLERNELSGVVGDFSSLQSLEVLFLRKNSISTFPKQLPSSLEELYLSDNRLNQMHLESVRHLSNLKTLHLDSNQLNDQSFEHDIFGYLVSLEELDLSQNNLRTFPSGLQTRVENVNLARNMIEFVEKSSVHGLQSLRRLDLAFNRLRSIEDGALQGLIQLDSIDFSGNNWSCDCYLKSLHKFVAKGYHRGQQGDLLCGESGELTGAEIEKLSESDFTCEAVEFEVLQPREGELFIQVADFYSPSYASFQINISGVTQSGNVNLIESKSITPGSTRTIAGLGEYPEYQICIESPYTWDQEDFASPCQSVTPRVFSSTKSEKVSTVVTDDVETIIGLVTGGLIVILSLIIVAVLFYKSKRFPSSKFSETTFLPSGSLSYNSKFETGITRTLYGQPGMLYHPYSVGTNYGNIPATLNQSQQSQQTVDAGSEFAVQLIPSGVGAPPPYTNYPANTTGNNNNEGGVFV